MSKAAHQIAIKSVSTPEDDSIPKYLVLAGNTPFAISVSYDSTNKRPVFSCDGQQGYNLSWQTAGYALIINLTWSNQNDNPITEFAANTPSCWFANAATTSDGTVTSYAQTGCVPPVPGVYHFVPDDLSDPVIIVTPIQT